MKLNEQGLLDPKAWSEKGYGLPQYDRAAMIEATKKAPFWIHFGAGNIFRAFQANAVQTLLNNRLLSKGLIVAEGYDYEIISKLKEDNDNLSILVTLKADGSVEKTVVGSIAESLALDTSNPIDFPRLQQIFSEDSLQMASFTITEKGYRINDGSGNLLPDVQNDFKNGPLKPDSYIGKVASLLYARYLSSKKSIAMVSMDNCSHNGDKLYAAIHAFAKAWEDNGVIETGFVDYIDDKTKVSFPWTMIDKITPRPDDSIKKLLEADGIEQLSPTVTKKHTYIAPYVNAEECEYLVIEDSFPNGRPSLEKAGFIFTDRATVDQVEKMKVCTCLNPLHTALAVFGCLLGYKLISEEMKDASLNTLVRTIAYKEGLPVVTDPGIINPKDFIDTVLNVRIPNPFMPDTPQRIATDTSQKLAIRYGETVKAYAASNTLQVSDLKMIPLVYAAWLRYLMGIDDSGNIFTLSPDPLINRLTPYVSNIQLGDSLNAEEVLRPILKDNAIFGIDLYEVGLVPTICDYFTKMIKEKGAVRETLDAACNQLVTA